MSAEKRLTVMACWLKAQREHPDDFDLMRLRYVELMREQGHIVPNTTGKPDRLPCGWTPKTNAIASLRLDGNPQEGQQQ